MQIKNKNKYVVFVAKSERPSQFMVDLKEIIAKRNNISSRQYNKDLGGIARVKNKADKNYQEETGQKEGGKKELYDQAGRLENKLSYFTIFPLLAVSFKIFKAIVKISYQILLGIVRVAKFIFWLLSKCLQIVNIFSWFKRKPAKIENKLYGIFNNKIPEETFSESVKNKISQTDWQKPLKVFSPFARWFLKIKSKIGIIAIWFLEKIGIKPDIRKKFHLFIKLPQLKNRTLNATIYFGMVMLLLALPFKTLNYYFSLSELRSRVLGTSEAAVENVKTGAEQASNKNFTDARNNFAKASNNFAQAEKEIKDVSDLLTFFAPLIPNNDVKMAAQADLVLEAGRLSSKIAEDLSSALSELNKSEVSPEILFNNFFLSSQSMKKEGAKLADVVRQIDPRYLPLEYKDKFSILQEKIDLVENSTNELADLADALHLFLGFDYDKRYLLVFQNNSELRASGGFIGSYALVDFSNGKVKNMQVPGGGSYDTEWGMTKRIIAPEALSIVNPRWYFWDSNWWPDWPTSARK
ncbi:MAG: DUF4012 domain-containing protein, partial [Candidatus Falkowbacteria bacterium]|nr:DUF4012 domain-containing protein [Candidatus Falkowbacteria bacterium]